jgi:hypothetical protein
LSRLVHIAVAQTLPDFGARNGEFVFDVGWNVHHIESVCFPAAPQQFYVAFSASAETVIVADHNGGTAQPVHQDFPNKFCRLEPRELQIEGLNDQMVQAGFGQGSGPLIQGLEQLKAAVFSEQDLTWVGVKGQNNRFGIF